jgi:hypothetical protein
LVAYPRFQIPLNPPFLKGEISHNDIDGTTIKAAKIYKTGGLEIKDTLRKCQQENEGCRIADALLSLRILGSLALALAGTCPGCQTGDWPGFIRRLRNGWLRMFITANCLTASLILRFKLR